MNSNNHYELLGVKRTATAQEIASAFRERARSAHPDKGGDPAHFLRLKHAREVLCDAHKRAAYDAELAASSSASSSASSPFSSSSSSSSTSSSGAAAAAAASQDELPRAPDNVVAMQISLQDAVRGAQRSLNVNRRVPCSSCAGSGMRADLTPQQRVNAHQPCGVCRGARIGPMGPCGACGMSGVQLSPSAQCAACSGRRLKHEHATVPFEIPRGCADGARIRLRGQAGAQPGQRAGDIVIQVHVQASDGFELLHAHLITDVNISLLEAIAGGERALRHPDGGVKRLRFDGGVQPGSYIVFPGLGLNEFASLALRVTIAIPRLTPSAAADARDDLARALSACSEAHAHARATTTRSVDSSSERSSPLLADAAAPAGAAFVDRHSIMTEADFVERARADEQLHADEEDAQAHAHAHAHAGMQPGNVQCAQS